MFKSVINKLLMVLYFVVGALILEFITFHFLNLGTMPEYFFIDLSIILIIGLIVYCIPNFTAQYVIYTIILLVQTILIYLNYTLYVIYGDLFSFDMLNLAREAAAAVTSNFVYFRIICQLILVFFAIMVVGLFLLKTCRKDKIKIRQHYSIFNLIILLSVQFFSVGYYTHARTYINQMSDLTDESYIESDAFLMNTSFLKSTSYTKFGSYGYMLNLFFNSLDIINDAHINATIDYFKKGNIYDNSAVFGVDKNEDYNNVIVIMMESLEWFPFTNGDIKSQNEDGEYVYDVQKVLNNFSYEFTPNIYSILYGDDYLTDQDNANRANDAMIFENFFAKSKTNISEGYGILGNYPVGQSLSSFAGDNYDRALNAFGYSLPSMLKANGFYTSYVHSNRGAFYSRSETHKNLGFDNVVFKDTLLDENGNRIYKGDDLLWDDWASEGDFARNAIDQLVPTTEDNSPFFTFYLNVSTHGAYTADDNVNDNDALRYYDYVKFGEQNCQLVKTKGNVSEENKFFYDEDGNKITDVATLQSVYPNANYFWERKDLSDLSAEEKYTTFYSNILKYYGDYNEATQEFEENGTTEGVVYLECGVLGLDDAIGVIIDALKQKNQYDNTTLVLYSDHFCYYGGLANQIKGFKGGDTLSIGLNTIPMIISSPGLKAKGAQSSLDFSANTRFSSAYDVIPTVLDMLGIPFNENYYLGHSIFRPADYTYVIDAETGLARDVAYGEEGRDMVVYYSNTGGLFSRDCYTIDLKTFYTPTGEVLNDEHLIELFKSEATNLLIKINYIHILNTHHLFERIEAEKL